VNSKLLAAVLAIAGLAAIPGQAPWAATSTRLKDVIASTGVGNIDLFRAAVQTRNLNAPAIEALRVDNNGALVFAVDVNEAAAGFEKSDSQGVAVDSARIVAVIDGTTHAFDSFSTRTQSSIARDGEVSRSIYYTLIGDGGSGRITSSTDSDINGSSFDATLTIPVSMDLSRASSIRLEVRLLLTNRNLGDPEDFYDYSNGFEDVAIVTASDARYLDQLAPGRDEAPLVIVTDAADQQAGGRVYYPAQDQFYVSAFEDQFPNRGDYDFNDLVVGYRVYTELDSAGRIVGIGGEGYLIARGGGFDHDWHLRIGLPSYASGSGTLTLFEPGQLEPAAGFPRAVTFNGALDLTPFEHTRQLWADGSETFVNTLRDQSLIRGYRFTFEVTLNGSLMSAEMPAPPYDPYLYVYNTGYEIHLGGRSAVLGYSKNTRDGLNAFSDPAGFPFALILPEDWLIPIEFIDLGEAYPQLLDFVTSSGTTSVDWFRNPKAVAVKPVTPGHWKW